MAHCQIQRASVPPSIQISPASAAGARESMRLIIAVIRCAGWRCMLSCSATPEQSRCCGAGSCTSCGFGTGRLSCRCLTCLVRCYCRCNALVAHTHYARAAGLKLDPDTIVATVWAFEHPQPSISRLPYRLRAENAYRRLVDHIPDVHVRLAGSEGAEESPDLGSCQLQQKLAMVQLCIRRRRQAHNKQTHVGGHLL